MTLEPQQLLSGERLDVSGDEFSEIDATLMVQLLLYNCTLRTIDLSGTKPLARELKVSPPHSPSSRDRTIVP